MRETVRIRTLPTSELKVSKLNPRRQVGDVDELAASIRQVGILQPLLVTPNGSGFIVLAGQRRLAAARKLRLKTVPCIVRHMSERQREIAMLVENVHRLQLTHLEEATVYVRLMKLHNLTQAEVAEVCGVSQTKVSHHLAFVRLPKDVVQQVERGEIAFDAALGLGAFRDYKAKPKQPQGRKSTHTLEGHESCRPKTCEVRVELDRSKRRR